jgi:hypothetical protein
LGAEPGNTSAGCDPPTKVYCYIGTAAAAQGLATPKAVIILAQALNVGEAGVLKAATDLAFRKAVGALLQL